MKKKTGVYEVIGYKNGARVVNYYTLEIYYGVTVNLFERFKRRGYSDITVRLVY